MIGKSRPAGFAYVALLVAIALIGLTASAALGLGALVARRDTERQLLAIGLEYQQALRSYAVLSVAATSPFAGRGPRSLDDLLKDPRVPGTRRHLRQLYADPLTGRADWGLVKDPQGYIVAVHSLDSGRPIRRTGFEPQLVSFEEAENYSQWIFGLPMSASQAAPR